MTQREATPKGREDRGQRGRRGIEVVSLCLREGNEGRKDDDVGLMFDGFNPEPIPGEHSGLLHRY
jgi:hypothetical protein